MKHLFPYHIGVLRVARHTSLRGFLHLPMQQLETRHVL